jgi:aminopeptidase-like protein
MSILSDFDKQISPLVGDSLYQFAAELYPICRSITGDGIRRTLELISARLPLKLKNIPTGTQVFDWTIPKEWNIRSAYINGPDGKRIVDFRDHNLHVLNYSAPIDATLSLERLKPHLFSLPDHPDWIPYRTAYYQENWGFCLSHRQLCSLKEGNYEVKIDSSLTNGNLTYGEFLLPGESTEEVLFSCHACHPSLANDNLSGITVAAHLAQFLSGRKLRYSYRFLFLPGTIGAITWLAQNQETANQVRAGMVLTCIGDEGGFHYKKSRQGDTEVDRAAANVLKHCGEPSEVLNFSPDGYDERQYCSPGFNLPVGCLMRSVWGKFPEYHTSADNLSFIKPVQLAKSLRVLAGIVDALEGNQRFKNLSPFCEPQLGKRNLYRSGEGNATAAQMSARLWVLNLSDGDHSLLEIAERSELPFATINEAAEVLQSAGLLAPIK